MSDETQLVHIRLPKALLKQLDHYAVDRNLYRAEALAEILEAHFGPGREITQDQLRAVLDRRNPNAPPPAIEMDPVTKELLERAFKENPT